MISSLQITAPAQKCIFKCPFCISLSHIHDNLYENLYEKNINKWSSNLKNVLINYPEIKTCVITGTNEPMQSPNFVNTTTSIIKKIRPDISTEIQTRIYKKFEISNLDVVCYSVSEFENIIKIQESAKTNRIVIILTDSFNEKTLNDILEKIKDKNITQITFKKLQTSNGLNVKMDNWIYEHHINNNTYSLLKDEVNNYNGILSIRFDENCMDSEDRYLIFREDGKLYENWENV